MPRESAASMFAALLDRSVARIGELAADGRFFDRRQVVETSDVWDNNTFPFFDVAWSPPRRREQRARDALRWMADLGPGRRAWMSDIVGERILGPAPVQPKHYRDHLGHVRPATEPLAGPGDYALDRATLRSFLIERAGTRLGGHVTLTAPRRFDVPAGRPEATVTLHLADIQQARLDSADTGGAALDGATIRVGAYGLLTGSGGTISVDDPCWHLSPAGRAADAITPAERPPRVDDPERRARLSAGAVDAALVLKFAMMLVRSVRYAKQVGRVPLGEISAALAGAGDAVLSAAARPWGRRDRALRRLAEGWLEASPYLTHELRRLMRDNAWLNAMPDRDRPAPPARPDRGQLTLATFRDGGALVNLAAAGTWELSATELPGAGRMTLDAAAFAAPQVVTSEPFALGDVVTVSVA